MTFKELATAIETMTDEQKNDNVMVYNIRENDSCNVKHIQKMTFNNKTIRILAAD